MPKDQIETAERWGIRVFYASVKARTQEEAVRKVRGGEGRGHHARDHLGRPSGGRRDPLGPGRGRRGHRCRPVQPGGARGGTPHAPAARPGIARCSGRLQPLRRCSLVCRGLRRAEELAGSNRRLPREVRRHSEDVDQQDGASHPLLDQPFPVDHDIVRSFAPPAESRCVQPPPSSGHRGIRAAGAILDPRNLYRDPTPSSLTARTAWPGTRGPSSVPGSRAGCGAGRGPIRSGKRRGCGSPT